MCYNAAYSIKKNLTRAIERERDPETREYLERLFEEWKKTQAPFLPKIESDSEVYYANAFAHPHLPVIHNEDDQRQIGAYRWGLVPRWCKEEKKASEIRKRTINARSESLFEKPSFRASALDRRCVVWLTGWFEYHHQGKKKYPFFIRQWDEFTFPVAGLWDEAKIDGESLRTVTIITTIGNEVMKEIHNNPKNPNRMPVILRDEQIDLWLESTPKEDKLAIQQLQETIFQPFPAKELFYYPVPPLVGSNGVGNSMEAQQESDYADLELYIDNDYPT